MEGGMQERELIRDRGILYWRGERGGGGLKRNEKEMYHPVLCTSCHSSERTS